LSVANNIAMKEAFVLLRVFQQRVRQRIYRFCSGGPLVRLSACPLVRPQKTTKDPVANTQRKGLDIVR
jgi:hypothetical protein